MSLIPSNAGGHAQPTPKPPDPPPDDASSQELLIPEIDLASDMQALQISNKHFNEDEVQISTGTQSSTAPSLLVQKISQDSALTTPACRQNYVTVSPAAAIDQAFLHASSPRALPNYSSCNPFPSVHANVFRAPPPPPGFSPAAQNVSVHTLRPASSLAASANDDTRQDHQQHINTNIQLHQFTVSPTMHNSFTRDSRPNPFHINPATGAMNLLAWNCQGVGGSLDSPKMRHLARLIYSTHAQLKVDQEVFGYLLTVMSM